MFPDVNATNERINLIKWVLKEYCVVQQSKSFPTTLWSMFKNAEQAQLRSIFGSKWQKDFEVTLKQALLLGLNNEAQRLAVFQSEQRLN